MATESHSRSAVDSLETACPICDGAAGHTEQGEWTRCAYCEGAGYLPTEAGQRVLELVRHNLPLMLRDAAEAG